MTSIQTLSEADLLKLEGQRQTFKIQHIFTIPIIIVVSLLGGLPGIQSHVYLLMVALIFVLSLAIYLVSFLNQFIKFKKDLREREKIVGVFTVTGKSTKEKEYVIKTDLDEIKKLDVYTNKVFSPICEGDKLYIEFTRHRKFLLTLQKDNQELLEGNL